ncbi:MAG: hydroxymethylbilane synthase [Pseudonocardiales bacterium]|jgi:hydroxymethylbilane synthase|uniref:hydroxymethylbilane synthase n=1 Tax=Pseudonocardia sp. Cha107L01 TaxID=3457576 RepID=UPI0028C8E170|nr:hydroxymethylbilane synthase [Pseudonocardiales bacterium]MDT7593086.1 hydroxymethylbilane synthase [Pseudonocardiales bacterium]MDT7610970.1 hydroxymethylbilane synthase [Pseudonocardiales bacterium]MDT7627247.1 hydroxymethylbilane synthase [Pseudonocardiales bacterium]MDT7628146.1 hydroxymethylbilane synthase [Pseudonocardiales bacterium]
MTERILRIGTRGSALALAQAGHVADVIRAAGCPVELTVVRTTGDESLAPVAELGVGVFTTALRDALSCGDVDFAVHSYKDLPTARDPRFTLAAVPLREDPRDALVARDGMVLGELPAGSRVGTGSPRRAAQLRALGLGLEIVQLRGNVDTRIGKVRSGELDAVVLARAGLSRLGRLAEITETLDPLQMLPAPAQGALAIECRVDDMDTEHRLGALNDPASRVAVSAERAMLAALEAGCSAPVGALAEVVEDLDDEGRIIEGLSLRGVAATTEGALLRASITGKTTEAESLGRALAAELLDLGAESLPATGGPAYRWIGSS